FLRMLVRAAVLRRGRAASALLAMVVAAAVATAMLNLYSDVQAKLQREFRNYGANIVILANSEAPLPAQALEKAEAVLLNREDTTHSKKAPSKEAPAEVSQRPSPPSTGRRISVEGLAVPFGYVVARTTEGQSVVVVGTDFERVRRLNSWWKVSVWPSTDGEPEALKNRPASSTDGVGGENVSALLGMRAAQVATPNGEPFDLSFQGRTIHVTLAGTLQTG